MQQQIICETAAKRADYDNRGGVAGAPKKSVPAERVAASLQFFCCAVSGPYTY